MLNGKVALITGGSSGIGEASAHKLAEQGAKVAILSRDKEEVNAVVDAINQKYAGHALALIADISKEDQIIAAYEKLMEEWGQLDIVFANAGVNGVWTSIEDLTSDEWRQTIDINLTGTFLTVKYAIPHMKQNGGSIIITASVNGTRMFSNTGASAYATSKAGQVAFTKMIALEVAKHKIRVNVICPGAIDTEIDDNTQRENLKDIQEPVTYPAGKIPLTDGKSGTSEQVADLVFFLASDMSSHITGTELWIDGGQSLLQG